MGDWRAGRRDDELQRRVRIESRRTPDAVGGRHLLVDRAALPLARVAGDVIDFDYRALNGPVGRRAVYDAGDAAVQNDLGLGSDPDAIRRAADNELVDFSERARSARGLAMIDLPEQNVRRALQRRPVGGYVDRRAGVADETAVWLCIEVEAVAAQRQERHARRDLAVARV